ncbi:MAG: hypothetical protein P4L33_19515 [Capsulimonadaceae bacterium]|nr:hypothetical protein [Capsulimonadaceae bacterium]
MPVRSRSSLRLESNIALLSVALFLWLSTVGAIGHTDDLAGFLSHASRSHSASVDRSTAADAPDHDCMVCMWQSSCVAGSSGVVACEVAQPVSPVFAATLSSQPVDFAICVAARGPPLSAIA